MNEYSPTIAEAFYGDVWGSESYLSDYNLAVRQNDGKLYIGRYKEVNGAIIPHYPKPASLNDERYLAPLRKHRALLPNEILVLFGEEFYELVAAIPELASEARYYFQLEHISDSYPGFKGFYTTYNNYRGILSRYERLCEKRLYECFEKQDKDIVEKYAPYYELWSKVAIHKYSTNEKLALDAAWRLFSGEDQETVFAWSEGFAKLDEKTSFQIVRELVSELLRS